MKSYTSVEQSRKLAEILPLESADMFCADVFNKEKETHSYNFHILSTWGCNTFEELKDRENKFVSFTPAWSLAALLDILPKDKSIDCAITFGYYNGKGEYIEKWLCAFEKEGETTDDFIIETIDGSNPVDACVAMIIKLHELKLL